MTDYDVLCRYAEIMNGHVTGPYIQTSPRGSRAKDSWYWAEARQAVVKSILDSFWPYLGERRRNRALELGFRPGTLPDMAEP